MTVSEVIEFIRALRILITSILMMILSVIFALSAIFNGNLEHAAIALILNSLSMYEINEDLKDKG